MTEDQAQRVNELLNALSNEAGVRGVPMDVWSLMLQNEVSNVNFNDHNLTTFKAMMVQWLEHFRDNLYERVQKRPHITDIEKDIRENRSWKMDRALVIGGGPSVGQAELNYLRDNPFPGLVICCNKPFKKVLPFLEPDIVVAIHGTDEILPDFTPDIVKDNLQNGSTRLVLSTHIAPIVTDAIMSRNQGNCDSRRIFWFNPSIPEVYAANIDSMQELMSGGMKPFDTGGNAGLFGMKLAGELLHVKEVAMLGLEHCMDVDPNWTLEQSQDYRLLWDPDNKKVFAIPSVFQSYLASMSDWIGMHHEVKVTNLTPKGSFYVNRRILNVPYMSLPEYIEQSLKSK